MKRLCCKQKVLALVIIAGMCINLCTGITVYAQESKEEITEQNEQETTEQNEQAETENSEVVEEKNPDISKEDEEKANEIPEEIEQREVSAQENKEQVESGEQFIGQSMQGEELSAQSDSGKCGENVTWSYENGTLTISGSGPMEDYDLSEKPWEETATNEYEIRKVIIEGGVTTVGARAFQGYQNLTEITLPDSLITIGESAFAYSALTEITIPANVSSIGESAFGGCDSLYAFNVAANNSKYCSESGVLYSKNKTELIQYPYGKKVEVYQAPSNVTRIGNYAFSGCNIKKFVLGNNVKEIGEYAFFGCGLTDVTFGDKLESIEDGAFVSSGLTSVTIPGKVTLGRRVFWGCELLEKAVIKEGVMILPEETFSYTDLTSVSLPTSLLSIGESAFAYTSLKNITIPARVSSIGKYAFMSTELKSVVVPEGVTKIGTGAFEYCEKLTLLTIPKSVTSIGEHAYGFSDNVKHPNAKIRCYANTAGHNYAKKYGIAYELLGGNTTNTVSAVKVSKITVSGISKKIAAGKKVKLTASVKPSNASNKAVAWKSSNTKVATVNSSGTVTMKKGSGGKSVTITATAKDGSGVKATYKITSMKGVVKKVAITGSKSVKAGKTLKLKAKVTASKKANTKLKWTSSNTKYAKVSSSGKVKALKAGKGKKVKITAAATDGSGKKKTVTIKIK